MAHIEYAINSLYNDLPQWKEFVDQLPERFNQSDEVLYEKRNTIKRLSVNGESCVVKRFKQPNFIQLLGLMLGWQSKAEKAYYNGHELLRRGITTPQPIAYVTKTTDSFTVLAYYVCEYVELTPVKDAFRQAEGYDHEVAAAFAAFAASLHRAGVLHDDLNSTNTLYERDDSCKILFSVIDINRMRFKSKCPSLTDCLENLTRFTGDMTLFKEVAEHYADVMADTFGMKRERLVEMAIRQKEKHDAQWSRRKGFLKIFKKSKNKK